MNFGFQIFFSSPAIILTRNRCPSLLWINHSAAHLSSTPVSWLRTTCTIWHTNISIIRIASRSGRRRWTTHLPLLLHLLLLLLLLLELLLELESSALVLENSLVQLVWIVAGVVLVVNDVVWLVSDHLTLWVATRSIIIHGVILILLGR